MAEEKLSVRKQMEKVIREGGTIMHDGRIIGSFNELPSEADLAKGDKKAEAQARAGLEAEHKRIIGELAKLNETAAAGSEPKTEAELTAPDNPMSERNSMASGGGLTGKVHPELEAEKLVQTTQGGDDSKAKAPTSPTRTTGAAKDEK